MSSLPPLNQKNAMMPFLNHAPQPNYRIGMIVPSSNTTMETEIPELLRRQRMRSGTGFTFHAARLRLLQVTPEALQTMNAGATKAVDELCDAQVDCMMYACLVAAMYGGRSSVEGTTARLSHHAQQNGNGGAVITSAGALVHALHALEAQRVAMITPYKEALTRRVAATLGEYGIDVRQARSLEVSDNAAVGRLDPRHLLRIAGEMDLTGTDALIISACVQMPSLAVIEEAEQIAGIPVISAATATTFTLLQALGIKASIAGAGLLLGPQPSITKPFRYAVA